MLEKTERIDQVEIKDTGHIQVRQRISILEDGVELSYTFHRYVVEPGAAKPDALVAYLGERLGSGETT